MSEFEQDHLLSSVEVDNKGTAEGTADSPETQRKQIDVLDVRLEAQLIRTLAIESELREVTIQLERVLGQRAAAYIQGCMREVLFTAGVHESEMPEKQLEIVQTLIEQLNLVGISEYPQKDRQELLLQVIGVTDAHGVLQKPGTEQLILRIHKAQDIFPDAESRKFFLHSGETFLEASIQDALVQLRGALEEHVVDALCQEIQKQSPNTPLMMRLNEINRILSVYRRELHLIPNTEPRSRNERIQLAAQIGLADDVGDTSVINVIGIQRNVDYAKRLGSIFPDKDNKANVIAQA